MNSLVEIGQLNPPPHLIPWLTKPMRLSEAMKRYTPNVHLKLLSQDFNLQNDLIRQIYLLADEIPWSYGRVAIPVGTYKAFETQIKRLGENMIGETLLHHNPEVTRSAFEFAVLEADNVIFQDAVKYLEPSRIPERLWARRSTFYNKGYPLSITEVIFEAVPEFVE